ncbi:MAG: hypothetical protein NTW65_03555, partial [Deltaproteobacteria bacterium]|nr:hypothetical protein [Deltaproteobacteria bacterium]
KHPDRLIRFEEARRPYIRAAGFYINGYNYYLCSVNQPLMRLAENESRRVGMKFEALVELSHVRS